MAHDVFVHHARAPRHRMAPKRGKGDGVYLKSRILEVTVRSTLRGAWIGCVSTTFKCYSHMNRVGRHSGRLHSCHISGICVTDPLPYGSLETAQLMGTDAQRF